MIASASTRRLVPPQIFDPARGILVRSYSEVPQYTAGHTASAASQSIDRQSSSIQHTRQENRTSQPFVREPLDLQDRPTSNPHESQLDPNHDSRYPPRYYPSPTYSSPPSSHNQIQQAQPQSRLRTSNSGYWSSPLLPAPEPQNLEITNRIDRLEMQAVFEPFFSFLHPHSTETASCALPAGRGDGQAFGSSYDLAPVNPPRGRTSDTRRKRKGSELSDEATRPLARRRRSGDWATRGETPAMMPMDAPVFSSPLKAKIKGKGKGKGRGRGTSTPAPEAFSGMPTPPIASGSGSSTLYPGKKWAACECPHQITPVSMSHHWSDSCPFNTHRNTYPCGLPLCDLVFTRAGNRRRHQIKAHGLHGGSPMGESSSGGDAS